MESPGNTTVSVTGDWPCPQCGVYFGQHAYGCTYQPGVFRLNTQPWITQISGADVERIARRTAELVVELLKKQEP